MAGTADLLRRISEVFNECRHSDAVHRRKLKDFAALRSSDGFLPAFLDALLPLFEFGRRTAGAERVVRFVAMVAAHREEKQRGRTGDSGAFLEEFLRFLLMGTAAADKTVRFRSCQIISEIIMRLPDDAEVSDVLWDELIDTLKERVEDKVPLVRVFAVRALSRFANDIEDGSDIVDLFIEALPREPSAEVRKVMLLSLPASNATSAVIIERTLDTTESVRKAAYFVLANKFPLQSLSIKQRTIILRRGLEERSHTVMKECLMLLKDEWLQKSCGGDVVALLRYLDVETYERVGEIVMDALLKSGTVKIQDGHTIRNYILPTRDENEESSASRIQLIEPEVAMYWRTVCYHLHAQAQAKGSDAATTGGTEAAVYAAEASESNDLLEMILPANILDYVELVKAHLSRGSAFCFTSRQLLLLGTMLDFSDATIRKIASIFVEELLCRPLEHEEDEDGNKILIGDGINLGGDKDWARAVSELVRKVHASIGEFDEVVIVIIQKLADPCRERAADFMEWMHCLAVVGLYLEAVKSLSNVKGMGISASEILQSVLLPGARHTHMDVQRASVRCLGLFGLKEAKLSGELVRQLHLSFISSPISVRIMASKALLDLVMRHGPDELDRAIGLEQSYQEMDFLSELNLGDFDSSTKVRVLDLLLFGLNGDNWKDCAEADTEETVQAILGEGFGKILLLSNNYPSVPASLHPLVLGKLVKLYFSNETKNLHKLRQCLSVFFEHYPALSADHKKCISKSFIPVARSVWPGLFGNSGGAPVVLSAQRKLGIQICRFMLQMMQVPLYPKASKGHQSDEKVLESSEILSLECTEEGLAIRIAVEVISSPMKKGSAGKSYMMSLCKIVGLLRFRPSEQLGIKCMRSLLPRIVEYVSGDTEVLKELRRMATHLRSLDENPDAELSQEQAMIVFGKLELDGDLARDLSSVTMPATPALRSNRAAPTRRRARRENGSSDEEDASSVASLPVPSTVMATRSQRASKAIAMSRLVVEESESGGEEDSYVTSTDCSEASEGFQD